MQQDEMAVFGADPVWRPRGPEGLTVLRVSAGSATRAASIFTTHTPVPAGVDRFPCPLMDRYFGAWAGE
jgi:hypothetical protein